MIMDTETHGGTVHVARCTQQPSALTCQLDHDNPDRPDTRIKKTKLRMATDFSGMDMAAYAMKQAGVDVQHVFASESNPNIRAHIERNHNVDAICECALKRPVDPYRAARKG